MHLEIMIARLERQSQMIRALCIGVHAEEALIKPDDDEWSMLEVVNHLYEEERVDFRALLDYLFQHPGESIPFDRNAIDPNGVAAPRPYNRDDFAAALEAFLYERDMSLTWLRKLQAVDWEAAYETPYGALSAGDILASWVAHDILHLRQLTELHREIVVLLSEPYKTDYAGDW